MGLRTLLAAGQVLLRAGRKLASTSKIRRAMGSRGRKVARVGATVGLTGGSIADALLFDGAEEKSRNLLIYGKYVTDDEVEEQNLEPGDFAGEYARSLGINLYDEGGVMIPDAAEKLGEAFIKEADNVSLPGSSRYLDTFTQVVDPFGLTWLADQSGLMKKARGYTYEDAPKLRAEEAMKNVRAKTLASQMKERGRAAELARYGDVGEELIRSEKLPDAMTTSVADESAKSAQLSQFKNAVNSEGLSVALQGAQEKYPLIRNEILNQIRTSSFSPETADYDVEGARAMLSNAGYIEAPDFYPQAPPTAKAPAPAPPSTIAKPAAAPAAPAPAAAAPVAEQVRAQAGQPESGPSYADVLANPGGFTRGERYDALVGGKPPQMSEEEVLNAVAPTRGMTKGQRMDYYDQTLSPPSFSVATAGRGAAEGKPEAPQPQQSVQDAVRNAPETPVSPSGFMTGGRTQMPTLGGKYVHGFLRPSDWQDYNADELAESSRTGDSPEAVRMKRHIANKQKESADRGMEVFNRLFRPKTTASAPAAQAAPNSAPAAQAAPQARPAPQNYGDLLSGITPEQNAKLNALPPPTMLSTGPTFNRSGVGASLPGLSMPPASPLTPGLPEGFPSERNLSSIDGTSAGDISKFWRGSGPKKTAMPSASGYMRPMWEGTTNYFDPEAERLRPSNFTRQMKVRMPQAGIQRPNFK